MHGEVGQEAEGLCACAASGPSAAACGMLTPGTDTGYEEQHAPGATVQKNTI